MVTTEKGTGSNMSVDVSPGALILHNPAGYGHILFSTATENVPIATADALNPRISLIAAVLDIDFTNPSADDAEGGWEFIEVPGSAAAVPAAPDDTAIQTAAGAGNLYQVVASILVPANTPDIEDADITDARVFSSISQHLIANSSITTDKLDDNAVIPSKIANRTRTVYAWLNVSAGGVDGAYTGAVSLLADETTRQANFTAIMPKDCVTGSGTLKVWYSVGSTGTVNISLYVGTKDPNTGSGHVTDEFNGTSLTIPAAAANSLYTADFALTDVAADKYVGGSIARRVGDANTGELRIHAVGVEYTADS
jgi:hypothetical protein